MDLLETDLRVENRHPWEVSRITIAKRLIKNYTTVNSGQALDVGSGDAYIGHKLSQDLKLKGMSCVDILYSTDQMTKITNAYANDQLHLYNHLDAIPRDSDAMDFVTMMDVIEHTPDAVAMLSEVVQHPLIGDHTTFIITVPAHQRLFSRHDELLKHYRRYNLTSLEKTIRKCDLVPITKGYFFLSLTVVRVLQLIKDGILNTRLEQLPHLGTWDGSKLTSNLMYTVLMTDYNICRALGRLGIHLPGLSAFIVCKKA